MSMPLPLTRELVLIGGGHAHALVLRKWGMTPLAGVRLTVIDPHVTAPYTGMLPGYVAGHYQRGELDIDLVRLARHAGARLVLDHAIAIDTERKRVMFSQRPYISYDALSVDIGITADLPDISGFSEHAHAAKPLGPYSAAWDGFVAAVQAGHAAPNVAVIGAGVAGAELALAMAHRLAELDCGSPCVVLLEAGTRGLRELAKGTRRALLAELSRSGVALQTGADVASVSAKSVQLTDGSQLPTSFIVSAAGARPHDWLKTTGLDLHNGYINVDATLRSTSHSDIFAVGDCAHLSHAPRPKAGVFAVREAPILYDNLRACLTGKPMQRFQPQRDYLKLISTGRKSAVADKFGVTFKGQWLWRLKDRIDQKFMHQFRTYPDMAAPELPEAIALGVEAAIGDGPLCGGCGSKLAHGALQAGLSHLPAPNRSDVLSGPGDDAAVLQHGSGQQVVTSDHLRAFVEDPWLMARTAAVHAMGDIWAMGATPQIALANLVLPRMSPEMQADMLREIMAGAGAVVTASGADIAGGHTSQGAELTIGFTVTGLVEGQAIGLAGARPGDALVLTKPIGTGTILAGEMRGLAEGHDVETALKSMVRPQARASEILSPHAQAMTDVTGFGLAGHLLTMLEASGVAAKLDLASVPVLPGAEELIQAGVKSTIWSANAAISEHMSRPDSARSDLLFDPQTAGGLLAAIPASQVQAALKMLRNAGEPAALIGEITKGEPFIAVS